MGLLADQVCIVTGAGQGLGRSVSIEMAAEGAKVMLLEQSETQWNGFPWFRIRFGKHREGFMWGGILCGIDGTFPGVYETCPDSTSAK